MKDIKHILPQFKPIIKGLPQKETYIYLVSGFFMIIGLIITEVNFLFYLSFLFLFDFIFQNIPVLNSIQMVPLLSPVYNHFCILKMSSVYGGHVTLFLIITAIGAAVNMLFIERRAVLRGAIIHAFITA